MSTRQTRNLAWLLLILPALVAGLLDLGFGVFVLIAVSAVGGILLGEAGDTQP